MCFFAGGGERPILEEKVKYTKIGLQKKSSLKEQKMGKCCKKVPKMSILFTSAGVLHTPKKTWGYRTPAHGEPSQSGCPPCFPTTASSTRVLWSAVSRRPSVPSLREGELVSKLTPALQLLNTTGSEEQVNQEVLGNNASASPSQHTATDMQCKSSLYSEDIF